MSGQALGLSEGWQPCTQTGSPAGPGSTLGLSPLHLIPPPGPGAVSALPPDCSALSCARGQSHPPGAGISEFWA